METRLLHHCVETAMVKMNNAGTFHPLTINLFAIVSLLLSLHRPTHLRYEGFEINTTEGKNKEREEKILE
jgi:hypothetical protein